MIEGAFPGWTPVVGSEHGRIIADLARTLENPLPDDAAILRRSVGCYPSYELLRVRLEGPLGVRESYLLYSPGDPVPLDFTSSPIHALNGRALKIEAPEDAAAYLRLFLFTITGDEGRFFIVENVEDLNLHEGVTLDPQIDEALEEELFGLELLDPEPDDEAWQYRFRVPILYGTGLFHSTFLIDRTGEVVMVDDEPVRSDLPVVSDEIGSDRYFVLIRSDAPGITPHEFLSALAEGEPIEDVRVLGNVDARGIEFERPIEITRVRFNGDVTFEGARFTRPVRIRQCTFNSTLDLREARADGSVIARRLDIGEEAVARPGLSSVLLAAAFRVEGGLDLRGARVRGGVDLRNARIDGNLNLGGCDIASWSAGGWDDDPGIAPTVLDISGAKIGGDLDFTKGDSGRAASGTDESAFDARIPGFTSATAVLRGTLLASNATVLGGLGLSGLRCHGRVVFELATIVGGVDADQRWDGSRLISRGDVVLTFCKIRGNVGICGIHVGGDLQLFTSEVDGSVFSRCWVASGAAPVHSTVRGDVDISGLTAADVEFEGAELGGFRMITGDIGRVRLLPGIEPVRYQPPDAGPDDVEGEDYPVSYRWKLRPSEVGSIIIQTARIRNALTFPQLHIEPSGREEIAGLVELSQIECGGDVQFWSRRPFLQMSNVPADEEWIDGQRPELFEMSSRFPRGLSLKGVRAEGELSLVNVEAEGTIVIRDCTVGHDIDLGSHGAQSDDRAGQTSTRCHRLELEATSCDGDVDLSGLHAVGPGGKPGDVLARRLRVGGKLVFSRPLGPERDDFEHLSEDPAQRVEATIAGRLDLSAAEAAHLVISGNSFQDDEDDRGISFERGTFRRFQVVYPFPACHDSSDISVERWEIPDKYMLKFLDDSSPIRRSTYLGVERVLRNDGNDELADEVFRAMRKRVQDDATLEPPPGKDTVGIGRRVSFHLRHNVSRFLGATIGWGTQSFKPLILGALLFPLSVWVFSAPENIIPTTALLEVTDGLSADATPTDYGFEWGAGDGTWLALRYHVPVVPILARDRWEPSIADTHLRLPGDRVAVIRWMSPEDYAFTIFILHWVIWPLFLIGITTKVIRERA